MQVFQMQRQALAVAVAVAPDLQQVRQERMRLLAVPAVPAVFRPTLAVVVAVEQHLVVVVLRGVTARQRQQQDLLQSAVTVAVVMVEVGLVAEAEAVVSMVVQEVRVVQEAAVA